MKATFPIRDAVTVTSQIKTEAVSHSHGTNLGAQVRVQAGLAVGIIGSVAISQAAAVIDQYLDQGESISSLSHVKAGEFSLAGLPDDPKRTAQELKKTILESGLFYESHQANLIKGRLPLAQLMLEPQNKPGFNPSEHVARQLDVIEKQSVTWVGEVWPGQTAQWKIGLQDEELQQADEKTRRKAMQDTSIPTISTTLVLDMPNLKKISAQFTLRAGELSLVIDVQDPHSAELCQRNLNTLVCAIDATGQKIRSCSIKRNGKI